MTEFIYRYNISGNKAHVLLSFKLSTTNREQEVQDLLSALEKEHMQGFDISDDELAKSHVRYLIGGRLKVPNERIFRFGACCPPVRFARRMKAYFSRSLPGASRGAAQVSGRLANRLEYITIPLSKPWGR